MFWVIVLPVFIIVVFWLGWRQKNRRLLQMANKFPGPKTVPFLGNAWLFMSKPEDQMDLMKNLMTEYGDIVRFWLGPDLNFLINNPGDVKALLTNPKTSYKGPQYKYMADILGGGILSGSDKGSPFSNVLDAEESHSALIIAIQRGNAASIMGTFAPGPVWKLHRKLAAPNYGKQAVENYSDIFNTEMDKMLADPNLLPRGRMFNIYNSVVRATTYSVCRSLMGLTEEQTMTLPHLQMVIEKSARLYDIIFNRMTKWYLQIDAVFWLSHLYREQESTMKLVREFTRAILKHRVIENGVSKVVDSEEDGNTDISIVDRFLTATVMSEESLWQETLTIFTSSQEAGAKMASFLLLMMAYHPDRQEKLYGEITSVMSENEVWVTGDHIKRMPYLDMVFREITRLFPIGAIIQRSIQEDIEISSGTLPAGSSLAIPIYHIHRDSRYWGNPNAFDPERFSPENTRSRNPNCFIPFSLGPMDCLGRYFAAKLVKTICVRILREYKISSLDSYKDLKIYIAISAKSLHGYNVILEPRN